MIFYKFIIIFFIVIFSLYPKEEKFNHFKMKIALKTTAPEVVRKKLLNFTNEKNGYLKGFDNTSITLIFPISLDKEEIISFVKNLGTIVSQNLKTEDYTDEVIKLQTKIKVKEKYLKELNELVGEADLLQTLDMEKEISKVIQELEELKGNYNYYLELISTQEVNIQFVFLESSAVPIISAPGWVSSIGIYNFYKLFRGDIKKDQGSEPRNIPLLPNFAIYENNSTFKEKYITADGIQFGIREVENKPKADSIELWHNAVINFLEISGYTIKEKKNINEFKFILAEGTTKEERFIYGIAFKIKDNDTVLLMEVGGYEKHFHKYYNEIINFIQNYKKK